MKIKFILFSIIVVESIEILKVLSKIKIYLAMKVWKILANTSIKLIVL